MRLVDRTKEDLADFVKRTRETARPPLSQRDVASRSGGCISHGYVSLIERRGVLGQGVSPKRLLGLARGLGVPIDEVVAVALGFERTELAAKQSRLIGFFDTLPDEKQTEAVGLLKALSEMYGMKTKPIAEMKKAKARRMA